MENCFVINSLCGGKSKSKLGLWSRHFVRPRNEVKFIGVEHCLNAAMLLLLSAIFWPKGPSRVVK